MGDLTLSDPLRPVVGSMATRLDKHLGLRTVGDLLRHYPRRYVSLGELTAIADLPVGEEVSLVAEVVQAEHIPMRQRRGTMLRVVVTDGTDRLRMTFFNAARISGAFKPGRRMLFSGKVETYRREVQLSHPKWTPIDADVDAEAEAGRPVPVYPLAGSLKNTQVITAVRTVLKILANQAPLPDPLPEPVRAEWGLLPLTEALQHIHHPDRIEQTEAARKRFAHEEAFVLQTVLARRRAEGLAEPATARPAQPGGLLDAFDAALPFELTRGQRAVAEQLAADLAGTAPMHRLLQGEVGSGKTVVALRAMLTVVDGGGQAALLAPTEVLAAQHHRSIVAMLGGLAEDGLFNTGGPSTKVVLLTGTASTAHRRAAMLDIAGGTAGIVVGTHALLSHDVSFFDLGLVVVDEQHRFGVEQRDVLREKGRSAPHLLVMTATPIPRTVAMTVFGDLETSTLTEVPAGRGPVATHVVPLATSPGWYDRVWRRVAEEVAKGHQAFVVCPRIGDDADDDGSDDADGERARDPGDVEAVVDGGSGEDADRPLRGVLGTLAELRERPELAGLRIEMLHGRVPAEQREATMTAMARGEVDVLVATTVIEVGVDVPNASVMVILDADRFGVSQLHQLRGRVGRGVAGGVCLLVTDVAADAAGRTRLGAVASTVDGFELARLDLEQRREGDVLGSRQSGRGSSLRLLRVLRDERLIERARRRARELVQADPDLAGHPALAAAIEDLIDEEQRVFIERG